MNFPGCGVHSVHPSMMQELEDMEEEFKKLKEEADH